MAARARHVNSESAASDRLMRDALKPSAIHSNEVAFSALPRRLIEEVPNPPQIPFTFLAYISDSDHGPPELNAGLLRCKAHSRATIPQPLSEIPGRNRT